VKDWQYAQDQLQQLFDYHRVGIITDFDGVLSPIVPRPEDATPTPRNIELLTELQKHVTLVAAISGRAVADVRSRIGLPELVYSGNHGLERWQDGQVVVSPAVAPYVPPMREVISLLRDRLPEGAEIEDKGATFTIHYRNAPNPDAAMRDLQQMLAELTEGKEVRVHQGRMIFELRPPLDNNKGTVFRQLIDEYDLQAAMYLGDDTTDADALLAAKELREAGKCFALGVGVVDDETPEIVQESADITASGVSDVESLFAWLLEAAANAS
jgi:trehalose 6-phosphate phosphatase